MTDVIEQQAFDGSRLRNRWLVILPDVELILRTFVIAARQPSAGK
jgi:hypothetical protein